MDTDPAGKRNPAFNTSAGPFCSLCGLSVLVAHSSGGSGSRRRRRLGGTPPPSMAMPSRSGQGKSSLSSEPLGWPAVSGRAGGHFHTKTSLEGGSLSRGLDQGPPLLSKRSKNNNKLNNLTRTDKARRGEKEAASETGTSAKTSETENASHHQQHQQAFGSLRRAPTKPLRQSISGEPAPSTTGRRMISSFERSYADEEKLLGGAHNEAPGQSAQRLGPKASQEFGSPKEGLSLDEQPKLVVVLDGSLERAALSLGSSCCLACRPHCESPSLQPQSSTNLCALPLLHLGATSNATFLPPFKYNKTQYPGCRAVVRVSPDQGQQNMGEMAASEVGQHPNGWTTKQQGLGWSILLSICFELTLKLAGNLHGPANLHFLNEPSPKLPVLSLPRSTTTTTNNHRQRHHLHRWQQIELFAAATLFSWLGMMRWWADLSGKNKVRLPRSIIVNNNNYKPSYDAKRIKSWRPPAAARRMGCGGGGCCCKPLVCVLLRTFVFDLDHKCDQQQNEQGGGNRKRVVGGPFGGNQNGRARPGPGAPLESDREENATLMGACELNANEGQAQECLCLLAVAIGGGDNGHQSGFFVVLFYFATPSRSSGSEEEPLGWSPTDWNQNHDESGSQWIGGEQGEWRHNGQASVVLVVALLLSTSKLAAARPPLEARRVYRVVSSHQVLVATRTNRKTKTQKRASSTRSANQQQACHDDGGGSGGDSGKETSTLHNSRSWMILMIDSSCAIDKSDKCDSISKPSSSPEQVHKPRLASWAPASRSPSPSGPSHKLGGVHRLIQLSLLLLTLSASTVSVIEPAAGHRLAAPAQEVRDDLVGGGGAKWEFWRQLVGSLMAADEGPELAASSDTNRAGHLQRLAKKLNDWPDQRQATLFYLDLVARKRDRMLAMVGSATPPIGQQADPCRRSTLAELVADRQHPVWASLLVLAAASNESSNLDGGGELAAAMERLVELNEFNSTSAAAAAGGSLWWKLNHEPKFLEPARLAVDVANLISRLLIHPESEVIRRLASQKFFKYLLESKLLQLSPAWPELHSAGLVFWGSNQAAGGVSQQQKQSSSPKQQLFSWPEFAPLTLLSGQNRDEVQTIDLASHSDQVGRSNGYFGGPFPGHHAAAGVQPFLAKWTLNKQADLQPMKLRLSQSVLNEQEAGLNGSLQFGGAGLSVSDGRWFSPYLDCGLTNRWLFTYSIPFFASSDATGEAGQGEVKFRGVAFVSLDFGKLKLIDQCADEMQGQAFLANTHHCDRLQQSQCIRLTGVEDVRSGAYVCQCPMGGSVMAEERRATELYRDKLTGLALQLASNVTGSAMEQLAVELDGQLADKSFVATSLLSSQQERPIHANHTKSSYWQPRYFALGAQLESDASLDWLTGSSSYAWPVQVCRLCRPTKSREIVGAGEANYLTSPSSSSSSSPTADSTKGQEEAEDQQHDSNEEGEGSISCQEFHPSSLADFNWVRPLVVTLQSICLLITFGLVGILLRIRKSRIILISGWLMLETTLIGASLLYTSVLVHYFEPTSVTCLLEPWLRELGFSIFYGSILIKLYRILTEFQTRKAHRVCFSDKDQIVYLLAIVLIVVGYMSAWTALMVDGFFFGRQVAGRAANEPAAVTQSSAATEANLLRGFNNHSIELDHVDGSSSPLTQKNKEPFMPPSSNLETGGESGPQHHNDDHQFVVSDSRSRPIASFALLNYSVGGQLEAGSRLASAVDQLAEYAPEQLKNFAKNFNSLADIFSGLVETQAHLDHNNDSLTYSMRCRKLTWDYVTELSEMALLVFGIYLIYKLRNASSEVHKEKLVLCSAIFIELLASSFTYIMRHLLWNQLLSDQILLLYFVRCQLTITVNIALVFGPKLYTIGKGKPTLFSLSGNRSVGGSMRHRCHISCELHDHHLNDAMRLHQAMLSNAALDIGSINLADMDPDEIQAELKRVYAQLEVLKTKAMRRDNPHISKRRGGRKTGHRKFSLQAFHAKHLIHHPTTNHQTVQSSSNKSHTVNVGTDSCSEHAVAGSQGKLPTLVESEHSALEGAIEELDEKSAGAKRKTDLERHTNQGEQEEEPAPADKSHSHLHHQNKHHHQHHHHHHHNNRRRSQPKHEKHKGGSRRPLVPADPASTSSIGGTAYYDEDTLILNDSQSSGNVSPQRRSSFVCSQSSIHPEDSSCLN